MARARFKYRNTRKLAAGKYYIAPRTLLTVAGDFRRSTDLKYMYPRRSEANALC